jgi:hypothetical protein
MLNLGKTAPNFCKWLAAFMMLALPNSAFAAPQQLYGRSVVVSWREDRQQKVAGDDQMRLVGAFAEMRVYISDKGRPFSRLTLSVANKHGKIRSGSSNAVDGQGSAGDVSFNRTINFNGATMTARQPRGRGGALQVVVSFDSGFQGCSAQVLVGKSAGIQATSGRSLINGQPVEMYSVKAGGESCRLQNGNVFGN